MVTALEPTSGRCAVWRVLNIGLRLDNPPACGLRLCRLIYILFFKALNHQESERFEKRCRLSAVLGSVVRLGSVRSEQTDDQTLWRSQVENAPGIFSEAPGGIFAGISLARLCKVSVTITPPPQPPLGPTDQSQWA